MFSWLSKRFCHSLASRLFGLFPSFKLGVSIRTSHFGAMIVYPSPYASLPIPKRSVYSHACPVLDPFTPDTPAFIDACTDRLITRAAFKSQTLRLARTLRNVVKTGGVALCRGSVVTIFSPNTIFYPVAMFATAAAGIRAVFANSSYTAGELAHILKDSGSSHILVHPTLLPTAISALELLGQSHDEIKRRVLIIPSDVMSTDSSLDGWITCDSLIPGDDNLPEDFQGDAAEETVFIYYSSGTTGLNKGVEISHYNATSMLEQCRIGWAPYEPGRDVVMGVIPFGHAYGGMIVLLFSYFSGVPVVVLPKFDPALFLSSIAKYRITTVPMVPPLVSFFAKHDLVDNFDLTSLRILLVGGAPLSSALINQTLRRLSSCHVNAVICQGLGLTEASGSALVVPLSRTKDKIGTVGVLLPNMEARLVDDCGDDVKEGEPGELLLRGPNVMKGYLNNSQANAETFTVDGWMRTGDVLTRDTEGFFTVVDRKKELIKYKGFQIPPAELEAILTTHPDIADAAVVGIYSQEEATELPRAFIVPHNLDCLKEADRRDFIAVIHQWLQTRVAHYKQLRGGIILTERIPRTAAGKILRRNLRDIPVPPQS